MWSLTQLLRQLRTVHIFWGKHVKSSSKYSFTTSLTFTSYCRCSTRVWLATWCRHIGPTTIPQLWSATHGLWSCSRSNKCLEYKYTYIVTQSTLYKSSPTPSSEICQFPPSLCCQSWPESFIFPPQTDGNGHHLALAICGHAALPAAAQNYQPNAAVGDVPNPWNPNLDTYQHLDILQLVIFYNDDFSIIAGDPIATRIYKVRTWLVEQEWCVGKLVNGWVFFAWWTAV